MNIQRDSPIIFKIIEDRLLLIQARGKPIKPKIKPYQGRQIDKMPSTKPAVWYFGFGGCTKTGGYGGG